jgi:S-adenosylmethionine:tRNA ribosyltransferase-isomerase
MTRKPSLPIELFDYDLPEELIAQRPAGKRTGSRLIRIDRRSGVLEHMLFEDFPDLMRENDLVVLNDTKVFPARLMARRATGGSLEILLLEYPSGEGESPCIVRPGRRIGREERVFLDKDVVIRLRRAGDRFTVSGEGIGLEEAVNLYGKVPLPPYIRREGGSDEADRARYQTIYAGQAGAVAAPTAGLHFDDEMLVRIGEKGVRFCKVTLHVGPGTFQPVRASNVTEHRMEAENYHVPADTTRSIGNTREEGGRIIAVGTTVVRTLETAWNGREAATGTGRSSLFIYPGYRFAAVDTLLTNLHFPRSTLLMLVCAFGGTELVMKAYREAVKERYRFYSYGDAMFIE